jgi:hypothetical protein
MKFIISFACLLISLGSSFNLSANTVFADGREWMQITETGSVSYATMASNCSTTTGVCTSGSIRPGNSLVGWTWASNDDVASLFDFYIGSEPLDFVFSNVSNPYHKEKDNSLFGPLFSADFGAFTFTQQPAAMTRDLITAFGVTHISVASIRDTVSGTDLAEIRQSPTYGILNSSSAIGQWVYRDVAAVPLPAAAFMFIPGLFSLGLLGFRRKTRV